MAKYWMWRIAAAVVPHIPLALARPLFRLIGVLAWTFGGETRRRAERNLRHIPSLAANTQLLQEAVRGIFITSALNYLDFLRGRFLTEADIERGWTVEGEHLIDEALAEERGVVLVSGHFGNMELAASRLAYRLSNLREIVVPVERMRPERLFDLFRRLRNHHNMHVEPGDERDALRKMTETVKAGGMLLIVGDRHILGSGARVEFFGEPSTFATAPMALALRTGAPIICAFSWRTGPATAIGVYHRLKWDDAAASAKGSPRGSRAEQVLPALRAFVRLLEEVIAAHPEAWVSALAPIWEAAPAGEPPSGTPATSAADVEDTSRRGVNFAEPPSVEPVVGNLT